MSPSEHSEAVRAAIKGQHLLDMAPYYRASAANWVAWFVAFLGWVLGLHATVFSVLGYFGACGGVFYLTDQAVRWRADRYIREARRLRELHRV